ncbi:MAG TPA: NAD(P)/FAD-dependent oxidoreductase, partial [Elusimicrobiota bacterium]|nr:NAD(P)/FAD-dependent oxidoreductase [Elusimicrobiota bacterium]
MQVGACMIGTFTDLHEAIDGNRCLLYHVIGGGTGDWDVPIGGMGVVSGGMERAARAAGAKLVTGAEVTAIDPDGAVEYVRGEQQHRVTADLVLAGVAPGVLARLLGETPTVRAEGAQVKVNLLLRRLPGLRQRGVRPEAAF